MIQLGGLALRAGVCRYVGRGINRWALFCLVLNFAVRELSAVRAHSLFASSVNGMPTWRNFANLENC